MKFWLYYFLKLTLGIPFRVFTKHVYVDGLENVPKGKPVLFSSNHPNSFLDGVIVEYFLRRSVFTVVRGDMFRKPVPNMLLRSMRLLPIFRARDAKASDARKGNEQSFNEFYELFKNNKGILIFSEADSWPVKDVRRFSNGTAGIGIDVYEKSQGEIDLHIVPTGLNYTRFNCKRGRIHLSFGPAIRLADLDGKIKEEKRKTISETTAKLQEEVTRMVAICKEDSEKDLVQDMALNNITEPMFFLQKEHGAQLVAHAVEQEGDSIEAYQNALAEHKVDDRNVLGNGFDLTAIFYALLTFAVSFPAYLLYLIIMYFGKRFSLTKIKSPIFVDSIYFGFGVVGSYVVMALLAILSSSLFDGTWAWVVFIAGSTGMVAWFKVMDELPILWKELKFLGLKKKERNQLSDLRASIVATWKQ